MDLINLLEQLAKGRENFTSFTNLLKVMIKDMDDQPDEMHRARSGRVLRAGTSVPEELGFITLQVCECVHRPGSFLDSVLWGFYGSFNINFILTGVRES